MIGSSPVADVMSAAFGILIIGGVTVFALRRLLIVTTTANVLMMSATLIGMTIAFEVVIRYYLDHGSWTTIMGNSAFWKGRAWPVVFLMLTIVPSLREHWRTHAPHSPLMH